MWISPFMSMQRWVSLKSFLVYVLLWSINVHEHGYSVWCCISCGCPWLKLFKDHSKYISMSILILFCRGLSKEAQMLLFSATYDQSVIKFAHAVVPNPFTIRLRREEESLDNIKQVAINAWKLTCLYFSNWIEFFKKYPQLHQTKYPTIMIKLLFSDIQPLHRFDWHWIVWISAFFLFDIYVKTWWIYPTQALRVSWLCILFPPLGVYPNIL